MKLKWSVVSLIALLVFAVLSPQSVFPASSEYSNRDIKGNVFIVVLDSSQSKEKIQSIQKELEIVFPSDVSELKLLCLTGSESQPIARQILALPQEALDNLGGIVEIRMERTLKKSTPALIEVYHYPFGSIAEEHVASPEYSFKFGSDSALLAIRLYESLVNQSDERVFPQVEIQPALHANPDLPREILKKSIQLSFPIQVSFTQKKAVGLAKAIKDAVSAFYQDEDSSVMGLVPEKALRHAQIENIQIQVLPFLYADQEFSKQEEEIRKKTMAEPVQVVKPFNTGLYYITGLESLTPYSLKFIDPSKAENDFWYALDEGSFLTSSLKGMVRTVPGKQSSYTPLENHYPEPPASVPRVESLDYVIEGVTVFDGSKDHPRYLADVGIAGEKIAGIGDLKAIPRSITLSGEGLFLTPGFIDIHSHADWNILDVSYAPSHVRQGITTVLGGNCASSPLGIGNFLAEVNKKGAAVNLCILQGNTPVRRQVLGRRKGMFSYADLYREKELIDLAMEEGAFGMSTGLIYTTSEEAFMWELAEMAKQMKPYGGFYASHVRGESNEVLDAIREGIHIGEIAEVPVQISHMKVINKRNWGDMKRYLEIMKAARNRGMDVTGDQYPWRATGPAAHYKLYTLLVREAIKNESPEVVLLKDMPGKYKKYSGRPLTELLEGEHLSPEELVQKLDLTEESKIYATYLCLSDEDVCLPMKEDFVMVCTDASLVSLESIEKGKTWDEHPRKFRTYPEFFSNYVRDRKICSWELGVYKCTGLPAQKMKLTDRGIIRLGAYADLVLFDPVELDPGVDYRDQTPPPKGIKWVFLNGQPVLNEGNLTKIRAGKTIYGYGNRKP